MQLNFENGRIIKSCSSLANHDTIDQQVHIKKYALIKMNVENCFTNGVGLTGHILKVLPCLHF